jgi:putative membrane protein insertion efficiency factor
MLLIAVMPAFGTPYTMKGPPPALSVVAADGQPDSPAGMVMLAAISFYRRFISPTQGPRCGFYPSCSAFGLHAVRHHGPVTGGLMTADRLMRCNALKEPGPDYLLRPDGKLYDPVEANLLKEP